MSGFFIKMKKFQAGSNIPSFLTWNNLRIFLNFDMSGTSLNIQKKRKSSSFPNILCILYAFHIRF